MKKMFTKKRVFAVVAATLCLAMSLTACGGGKSSEYPTKGIDRKSVV